MGAKRQEQAKQFADKIAGVESEEMARIEAIELAMTEQGNTLKEAFETGHRTNKRRYDEIHAEVRRLEGSLRTALADAQEDESERVNSLLHQAQEQVNARFCGRQIQPEPTRSKWQSPSKDAKGCYPPEVHKRSRLRVTGAT